MGVDCLMDMLCCARLLCVRACVVCVRFDFEGVDVKGLFDEFHETERRMKELKEKGGIQRQVRTRARGWLGGCGLEAGGVSAPCVQKVWLHKDGRQCARFVFSSSCSLATAAAHLTEPPCCCVQAELMYRRNKEEVEGLQAKRKQVRGAGRPDYAVSSQLATAGLGAGGPGRCGGRM